MALIAVFPSSSPFDYSYIAIFGKKVLARSVVKAAGCFPPAAGR
jgi:hypothetical protein